MMSQDEDPVNMIGHNLMDVEFDILMVIRDFPPHCISCLPKAGEVRLTVHNITKKALLPPVAMVTKYHPGQE